MKDWLKGLLMFLLFAVFISVLIFWIWTYNEDPFALCSDACNDIYGVDAKELNSGAFEWCVCQNNESIEIVR